MDLNDFLIAGVVPLIVTVLAAVLLFELVSHSARLQLLLIRRAVRSLPQVDQARWEEEWRRELDEHPREAVVTRSLYAWSIYLKRRSFSRDLARQRARSRSRTRPSPRAALDMGLAGVIVLLVLPTLVVVTVMSLAKDRPTITPSHPSVRWKTEQTSLGRDPL